MKRRQWLILILLVLAGGVVLWQAGRERGAGGEGEGGTAAGAAPGFSLRVSNYLSPSSPALSAHFGVVVTNAPNQVRTNKFAYRLSNTKQPLKELVRNEQAIVLRNALIDTGRREQLI